MTGRRQRNTDQYQAQKCRRFTDRNTEEDKKYINREKKGTKVKRKPL